MPPYETYKNATQRAESLEKIASWNNQKRICARCKKVKLQSIAELEHNSCLICGLEMLLENKT